MPAPPSSAAFLLVCAIALGACGDDLAGPPPVAGVVTARLVSPNGPEAAAMFEVLADPVEDVSVDSGSVFAIRSADRLRVLVARREPGEIRVRIEVRDTAAALEPRVLQVADSSNARRPSLDGYALEVVR